MIDHVWSVLCLKSIIDNESNNISLVDVIEKLEITGPSGEGLAPIQMEVVTLWTRHDLSQPSRAGARLRLVGPDNNQIDEPISYDVDLTTFFRTRHRVRMGGLPIRGSGLYRFLVELEENGNWREVAKVPLEVVHNVVEPAGHEGPTGTPATVH